MDNRFKHIYQHLSKYKLRLVYAIAGLLTVVLLASYLSDKDTSKTLTPVSTIPAVTTTNPPIQTTTIPPQTTTTLPDLSGVDFVALARATYGMCGEYHDLAIQVGWPEEEWPRLRQVMWRESRCITDSWNGADAGLTQINQVHSQWLSDMGWSHPDDMFNPEYNLTFALRLWETSGWKPWRFSGTTWGD